MGWTDPPQSPCESSLQYKEGSCVYWGIFLVFNTDVARHKAVHHHSSIAFLLSKHFLYHEGFAV